MDEIHLPAALCFAEGQDKNRVWIGGGPMLGAPRLDDHLAGDNYEVVPAELPVIGGEGAGLGAHFRAAARGLRMLLGIHVHLEQFFRRRRKASRLHDRSCRHVLLAALFATLFHRAAKRLPEGEFAKAACSMLLICTACLALLTFLRNGAWENNITIHYDTVTKSPNSPRANADYANVLCEADRYEDAITYAEKSMELGRKGRENFVLAQNVITIALIKLGKTDEAIGRNEEFIKDKLSGVDLDPLPILCLNVAQACITAKKPEDAYRWTLKALRTCNGPVIPLTRRAWLKWAYWQSFPSSVHRRPVSTTTARPIRETCRLSYGSPWNSKNHGEQQYAREIIEREYLKDPDDPHLRADFENLQKEEVQNRVQKEKWNYFPKICAKSIFQIQFRHGGGIFSARETFA